MKARSDAAVLQAMMDSIAPEPMSGCWLWLASVTAGGYGQIGYQGRQAYAHRVSWALHNGPIPEGMSVLHRCDVRCCINPTHLFLGNQADNMDDMRAKGRQNYALKPGVVAHNKGARSPVARERHFNARLSEAAVAEIRRRHFAGERQRDLAREFGVVQPHISRIVRNESWADAPSIESLQSAA
jgi:hypothetical protein